MDKKKLKYDTSVETFTNNQNINVYLQQRLSSGMCFYFPGDSKVNRKWTLAISAIKMFSQKWYFGELLLKSLPKCCVHITGLAKGCFYFIFAEISALKNYPFTHITVLTAVNGPELTYTSSPLANTTYFLNERKEKISIYQEINKALCASAAPKGYVMLPKGNYIFEDQQYQTNVSVFLITAQQAIKEKNKHLQANKNCEPGSGEPAAAVLSPPLYRLCPPCISPYYYYVFDNQQQMQQHVIALSFWGHDGDSSNTLFLVVEEMHFSSS